MVTLFSFSGLQVLSGSWTSSVLLPRRALVDEGRILGEAKKLSAALITNPKKAPFQTNDIANNSGPSKGEAGKRGE
ncbi:hypothetical protein Ddye_012880 [Dipteronia dyeriana]|uniref:Uncharacterized protein n=1 Tax=Dipteronia dyeriana TaxID=168575 RepID=A0AAD9X589_9ROSI|nr:hypothetical protein Ddye_012880 [Dipteronia dyeriana]